MLTANSTNLLTRYITDDENNPVQPSSISLTITRPDATTVDVTPEWGQDTFGVGRGYVNAGQSVFPEPGAYKFEWNYTIDGEPYSAVEWRDVSELDFGTADIVPLAELIEHVLDSGSVEPDIAAIERIMHAAADACRSYKGKRYSDKVTETRAFSCLELTLYPEELLEVTTVTDGSGRTLTHRVQPGVRQGEHVLWIEFETAPGYVEIEGVWGHEEFPADLVHAVKLIASEWYRRDMTGRMNTPGATGAEYGLAAIPPVARGLLDNLR